MAPLEPQPPPLKFCLTLDEMGLPGTTWQADNWQILRGNLRNVFYTPAQGSCHLESRTRSSYHFHIKWVLSKHLGKSCNSVCKEGHGVCFLGGFKYDLFYFPELKRLSHCEIVSFEFGRELPAFMPQTKECLVPIQPQYYAAEDIQPWGFCEAKHPLTKRFCPCIDKREEI